MSKKKGPFDGCRDDWQGPGKTGPKTKARAEQMRKPPFEEKKVLRWRSHVRQLFDEILQSQPELAILHKPLQITMAILADIAEHASKTRDEILIAHCCRLALYTFADPTHEDYDEARAESYLARLDSN